MDIIVKSPQLILVDQSMKINCMKLLTHNDSITYGFMDYTSRTNIMYFWSQ